MAFLSARASLSRRASLCDSAALSGVAPSVHKPNDPMPSQHTLLHSSFSIHLSPARMSQGSDIFDQGHSLFGEHVFGISTAVSPLTSPTRPLSQESGKTYTDLTGPSYSSTPATPADRQNRRGTRRFTSPVLSTSTSSKLARMDNDSLASVASANLSLFLNSSVNASSTSPYDDFLDDDAVESAAHEPAGDGSGSQLQRRDLQGHLQPALKARVDRYIQESVADAVEPAVARFKGKLDALQSRVDQLETALKQKETVTPSCQKVDKEVSVSTYF